MQDKCNRIGIFGGTFDPIHFGHLIIAEELREEFKLDKVLIIPSGNPPHKNLKAVSDAEDRYNMAKLAIEGNPFFELSRAELERPGNTYTIDTLRQLKTIYKENDTKLFFIIGADVIPELPTWKDYKNLFMECEFIAVKRPEVKLDSFSKEIEFLAKTYSARINVVETSLIEISSTKIRQNIRTGKSIKYLLPERVESYIYDNKLYVFNKL